MKKRPDLILARDMIEAAQLAQSFVNNITRAEFMTDLLRQSAVCRQLEIIGEAANRLTPEFRRSVPAVPWRRIIGMRNILIHMYEEVDLEELWNTVKKDLPQLVTSLNPALPK